MSKRTLVGDCFQLGEFRRWAIGLNSDKGRGLAIFACGQNAVAGLYRTMCGVAVEASKL